MTILSTYKRVVPIHSHLPHKGDPIGLTATLFFLSQLLLKMTTHSHKYKGSPQRTTKPITLGGMTSPFLSAAMVSTEKVVEAIELTKKQIEVTFFSNGVSKSDEINIQER